MNRVKRVSWCHVWDTGSITKGCCCMVYSRVKARAGIRATGGGKRNAVWGYEQENEDEDEDEEEEEEKEKEEKRKKRVKRIKIFLGSASYKHANPPGERIRWKSYWDKRGRTILRPRGPENTSTYTRGQRLSRRLRGRRRRCFYLTSIFLLSLTRAMPFSHVSWTSVTAKLYIQSVIQSADWDFTPLFCFILNSKVDFITFLFLTSAILHTFFFFY